MDTYEKKYNEIVGLIKKAYLYAQTDSTKAVLEEIFPELKESGDERIRGAIIDHLKDNNLTEWAAWLEKQGEKKPQRMISAEAKEAMYDKPAWSEEDELVIKDIEEAITNYWHGQSQEDLLDRLKSIKQRIKGE